jgi:primosomal protein N'
MVSKLRIRIGEVEVEYEGSEDFLKKDLPQLLRTAMELNGGNERPSGEAKPKKATSGQNVSVPSRTTGSIASKIEAKSGSELLKAAAAHLTFVVKKETFSRKELLAEMQSAKSYYKTSYSANLSKYFKTALANEGFLMENSSDAFALNAAARRELEKQLADN